MFVYVGPADQPNIIFFFFRVVSATNRHWEGKDFHSHFMLYTIKFTVMASGVFSKLMKGILGRVLGCAVNQLQFSHKINAFIFVEYSFASFGEK